VSLWPDNRSGPRAPLCRTSVITLRHNSLDRTPLHKWSARHRDLRLYTTPTGDRHSCPRLDSNPQSQKPNGCRTTSQTALSLRSA